MPQTEITDADIQHYEGLVRKTASRYEAQIEEDFEDICSILRIKVWRALLAYSATRDRGKGRDSYVFSCVVNQIKDLKKRNRRDWLFIEDVAPHNASGNGVVRDAFEMRYLEMTPEQAFQAIEDDFTLPSTLTETERQVTALLYLDFDYTEISDTVGITRREVSTSVRAIKDKMADWRPSTESVPIAA